LLERDWTAIAGNVPRWLSGRSALTVGPSTFGLDDIEIDKMDADTDIDEGDE
jgi:hypothetical protein